MFGLYVLCRNVVVDGPFGYRFGLAPVKARDENLPQVLYGVFYAWKIKNIRFSEAAVSRKMGAADPISALYAPMAELVDATGSNPVVREGVWVRVPLGAPFKYKNHI